jgi:hypothetical protein
LILEGLAFVAAAIATAVIGTPIASSLARPARFRRTETAAPSTRRARTEVIRAFEPLDLGPDPVIWPSERPWNLASTLQIPAWPSQGWNDEHFGQHWRTNAGKERADLGFHAMATRRLNEVGQVISSQPKPEARKPEARKPEARKAAEAKASPAAAPPKEKGQRRRQRQAEAEPAKVAPGSKAEASFFQEPPLQIPPVGLPQGVPDAAEIEHLISTVGLAGTVQAIMSRTGWDFREAAQYLARIRQGKG